MTGPRKRNGPLVTGRAQSEQQTSSQHSDHAEAAQAHVRSVTGASSPLFAARFKVRHFTCTLTLHAGRVDCEWDPRLPRRLSRGALREYRRGRDAALQEFARDRGLRIAVVDL